MARKAMVLKQQRPAWYAVSEWLKQFNEKIPIFPLAETVQ